MTNFTWVGLLLQFCLFKNNGVLELRTKGQQGVVLFSAFGHFLLDSASSVVNIKEYTLPSYAAFPKSNLPLFAFKPLQKASKHLYFHSVLQVLVQCVKTKLCVVYFDQPMGAPHAVSLVKIKFSSGVDKRLVVNHHLLVTPKCWQTPFYKMFFVIFTSFYTIYD